MASDNPEYRSNRLSYLFLNEMRYQSAYLKKGVVLSSTVECVLSIHNIEDEQGNVILLFENLHSYLDDLQTYTTVYLYPTS